VTNISQKQYGISTPIKDVGIIADKMLEWVKENDERVWLKTFFAETLSVPMGDVVEHWSEKSFKFRRTITLCRDIIEGRLLAMSLDKKKAAAGGIFALKNQFGWMDKQDVKKNVKRDFKITKETLEARTKRFFPKPDNKK
jgi:hypothetical protein